jgi:hypothetical protein
MIGVTTSITGLKEFQKTWAGFPKKFESALGRADSKARLYIVKAMRSIMASGGWQPNESTYQDWKSQHGYDTRPLFRTHLLANSISHERVAFSMQFIRSDIGWHEGMRYHGSLREQIYKSRVPKNARKYKGPPTSAMKSTYDTQFLARVALWMEKGAGGTQHIKTAGGKNQFKHIQERKTGHDNPPRPFVATTAQAVRPEIIELFAIALKHSLPMAGKLEAAPF